MRNIFQALMAIGFLIATGVSVWQILLSPNLQGPMVASSATVAQNQDPRCVPHPVKFPCLQKPSRS